MPAILPRPAAVICDMDGLLLDTERIALRHFRTAAAQFNVEGSFALYTRCIGRRGEETRAILGQAFGPAFPIDDMLAVWTQLYQRDAIERRVPHMAGAHGLLRALAASGIPLAVCTSTRRRSALHKLANAELLPFFSAVVGGDEVRAAKPNPEPYLTAARRLGLSADQSVVAIEDSDPGVRAAHAAGLRVIQIPDLTTPAAEVRALGHDIVDSLLDALRLISR